MCANRKEAEMSVTLLRSPRTTKTFVARVCCRPTYSLFDADVDKFSLFLEFYFTSGPTRNWVIPEFNSCVSRARDVKQ